MLADRRPDGATPVSCTKGLSGTRATVLSLLVQSAVSFLLCLNKPGVTITVNAQCSGVGACSLTASRKFRSPRERDNE
jgi:hypothetical protein